VSHGIRPSTTRSTAALWAKSLLNALLFFTLFMVAVPLLANWLLPASLPLPGRLRLAGGALLFFGGILIWIACLDHFSRRGHGTPFPLDAPRELVTSGPFAVVRNPIIVAELSVVWGEVLYFASFGIALYAVLATLAAHFVVIRVEEPELRERFGATYETYCRRVPRWLPTLRR
jgi:protein-S-isoprenylcysteine O-methyltransferase Ste14